MTKNLRTKLASATALAILLIILLPSVTNALWPVDNTRSYVSQRFRDGHRGLDIASPRWSPVVAIRTGKVVFAGYRRNCGGYQVLVSHGAGLYSAYYHLAREITFRGDVVAGGIDTIGYVGTSGCATGAHVHVEVWRGFPWRLGSVRVNPWNYVMDGGEFLPTRYR